METEYYDLLEINVLATPEEIKKGKLRESVYLKSCADVFACHSVPQDGDQATSR